jgi:hypothetical protein
MTLGDRSCQARTEGAWNSGPIAPRVRQDTRQDSRHTKQDCRAANQKSNAGCRHDKRETKQGGRQTARDIKY